MEWRDVKQSVARSSPYYGMGGWLLFFYVMSAFAVTSNIVDLSYWVVTQQSLFAFGDQKGVIWGDTNTMILGGLYVLTSLPFLVLAPRCHPAMPKIVIASNILYYVGFGLTQHLWDAPLTSILSSLAVPSVFIAYLLISKRVNATYRHRVPEKFARLAENAIEHNGTVIIPKGGTFWFRDKAFASLDGAQAYIDQNA